MISQGLLLFNQAKPNVEYARCLEGVYSMFGIFYA